MRLHRLRIHLDDSPGRLGPAGVALGAPGVNILDIDVHGGDLPWSLDTLLDRGPASGRRARAPKPALLVHEDGAGAGAPSTRQCGRRTPGGTCGGQARVRMRPARLPGQAPRAL
jgi:hypothetical protein